MSQSVTLNRRYQFSNDILSQSETIIDDLLFSIAPEGGISPGVHLFECLITASHLSCVYLQSDQDVALIVGEGSQAIPFDLLANSPYIWSETSANNCIMTYPFNQIEVTNSNGTNATIDFRFLYH